MRKVQDFIVTGKRIFVGLEDSKRSWKLCVRSEGHIVHELSMPSDTENLLHYLGGQYPKCGIMVMYEAGFGGFWLHDFLREHGIECIVTPPHTVSQPKVSSVKTDRVDARRLAKNLESGDFTRCYVHDRPLREDRQIVRTLNQIQQDIVRTKNRIRKLFDFHGLNGALQSGAWKDSHYRALREMSLGSSMQLCLDTYLDELDDQWGRRDRLQAALKELSAEERYCASVQSKQSVVGIGWLTAIRLTLEWGDISRFASGKHLASFVGLTSCEHSTGETVHRGRITGQGNSRVRSWLIQCAWRSLSGDPVMFKKFQSVYRNSGSKKKAIVAVARKLVVRLRAIELAGMPYCRGVIQ